MFVGLESAHIDVAYAAAFGEPHLNTGCSSHGELVALEALAVNCGVKHLDNLVLVA